MSEQKKPTVEEQLVGLHQQHEQHIAQMHAIEGAVKILEMVRDGGFADVSVNTNPTEGVVNADG